ncbi:MAG: pilin [Proteobacteria bacterium]|nr:pilin [Pseudomonadota bacterium]
MSLTSGVKTPLAEWTADKGALPADIASLGATTTGKYVASIALAGDATTMTVLATMKGAGSVNAKITGSAFALVSTDGGNVWDCTTAQTTIPDSLLPGACK